MAIGRFLGGVAAVIRDPGDGRYLLLQRAADKDYAPGVWEPVTGRVEQGESFEQALYREVDEEIGVRVRAEFILGTTHFHRGAPDPETELLGVVYACTLPQPQAVRLGPEHQALRWVTPAEAEALLEGEAAASRWCRRLLARAEVLQRLVPEALRAEGRRAGWELD